MKAFNLNIILTILSQETVSLHFILLIRVRPGLKSFSLKSKDDEHSETVFFLWPAAAVGMPALNMNSFQIFNACDKDNFYIFI